MHLLCMFIRRRYNNVLMDEERKMQAEIFLGLKTRLYFPTLHLAYRCVCMCAQLN